MKDQEDRLLDRETIDDWLRRYQPAEIESKVWRSGLSEFVRSAILQLDYLRGYSHMQRSALLLARISAWSAAQGVELDLDAILDPRNVDRWIELTEKRATARNDRSMVRRMAYALTTTAPWPPLAKAFPQNKVAPPYTPPEIEQLHDLADRQSTNARRRVAKALIAFGLGAGIRSESLLYARARDVEDNGAVVLISSIQPRPRVVPVLARYESGARELLRGLEPQDFIAGKTSRTRYGASGLPAHLDAVGPGRSPLFDARRLRNTWLLYHLDAGTPFNLLMRAAGLAPNGGINNLAAEYMAEYSFEQYKTRLRDA